MKVGVLPSQRLGIEGEVAALSFDLAVCSRLFLLEQQQAEYQAKLIAYEVSKIFAPPKEGEGDDSILESDLLRDDKYADANTQIW